ncbi:MAG: hypothetical protein J6J43_08695 [Oscillospiraceae bacterium]|nr:hypothetical protein [Oscillospiraceae bacterium]
MTDLHTHILPGVDDGAKTVQDSLDLLRAQREQGVDRVVLTPHYYPDREPFEVFLQRREQAWQQLNAAVRALPQEERSSMPAMVLGAEVAYVPGLEAMADLRRLCIGNTRNLLLELPFFAWSAQMIRQLYAFLEKGGVTPILAHIERYIPCQPRKLFQEILDLGLPVQVGTDMLHGMFSPAMKLLKQGRGHLIASDCHDLLSRRPNLGDAYELAEKKLGVDRCVEIAELTAQLTEE